MKAIALKKTVSISQDTKFVSLKNENKALFTKKPLK